MQFAKFCLPVKLLTSNFVCHDSGAAKLQRVCDRWISFNTSWIGPFFCFELPKAATRDETLDGIIGSHVHDLTKGIVGLCRIATEGREHLRGMFRVSCPG